MKKTECIWCGKQTYNIYPTHGNYSKGTRRYQGWLCEDCAEVDYKNSNEQITKQIEGLQNTLKKRNNKLNRIKELSYSNNDSHCDHDYVKTGYKRLPNESIFSTHYLEEYVCTKCGKNILEIIMTIV